MSAENANINDLPLGLKEKLLELCQRLPESARGPFVLNVAKRLHEVAVDHTHTIVYTLAGLAVGELLDHLLTFNVPLIGEIELTGDVASHVLAMFGGAAGFKADQTKNAQDARIRAIIADELRRASQAER